MSGADSCGVCGDTGTHFPVGAEYDCYCCQCYGCEQSYLFGEPCADRDGVTA